MTVGDLRLVAQRSPKTLRGACDAKRNLDTLNAVTDSSLRIRQAFDQP
jgi:hypothetical protein